MNRFWLLLLSGMIAACSSRQDPDSAVSSAANQPPAATAKRLALQAEAPETADAPPEAPAPEQPSSAVARKIIQNAQLRFRVRDFTASGQRIEQIVRQQNGQIANANETRSGNSIENELTVRIPADRLDRFISQVLTESMFTDTKTITAEDVTRQYVDVEARIRSKKAVEQTYLNLLKQAKSVADVLKVQEQLAQIQEERDVQEAELRLLKDQVALSTVHLTYYQQTPLALNPEEPFYVRIGQNLADGFQLLGTVLVSLFYVVPLGLVVAGVSWLIIRWRRRRKSAP